MPSPRPVFGFALVAVLGLVSAFAVQQANAAQLTASWVDNSDGRAAFEVDRKRQDDPRFTTVALVPTGFTSYVDAAIVEGVTYCYRVRAYNDSGESPYSEQACGAATPSTYSLTITKAGKGAGTVASAPEGINCGSNCARTYWMGSVVTLTAVPAVGSRFVGWSGGCSGTGGCTVTANTAVSVTATFGRVLEPKVVTTPWLQPSR